MSPAPTIPLDAIASVDATIGAHSSYLERCFGWRPVFVQFEQLPDGNISTFFRCNRNLYFSVFDSAHRIREDVKPKTSISIEVAGARRGRNLSCAPVAVVPENGIKANRETLSSVMNEGRLWGIDFFVLRVDTAIRTRRIDRETTISRRELRRQQSNRHLSRTPKKRREISRVLTRSE